MLSVNMTDVGRLRIALRTMLSVCAAGWLRILPEETAITTAWLYVPLGLICCFLLLSYVRPAKSMVAPILRNVLWLGLFGICIMFALSSTYNPFIYFRF